MKHRKFTLKASLIASLMAMLAALVAVPLALAAEPSTVSLTLPGGGTNTVTYSYSGIKRDVYASFKPAVVQVVLSSAAPDTATVTVARASGGPAYHTCTVASNGTTKVSFETNDWYVLEGDTIAVSCSSTNAGTVTLIGVEQ